MQGKFKFKQASTQRNKTKQKTKKVSQNKLGWQLNFWPALAGLNLTCLKEKERERESQLFKLNN